MDNGVRAGHGGDVAKVYTWGLLRIASSAIASVTLDLQFGGRLGIVLLITYIQLSYRELCQPDYYVFNPHL